MMRPITIACVSALYFATAVSGTATAASTEIFPSLRKRAEKKRLAAAQQHTENAEVAAPEPEEPVVKEVGPVLAPMDAGPDGYPVLPAVSTMLSDASGTMKAVNAKASSLEARVVQAQMVQEAKMAKQKAAFDEKLKQQEGVNRRVIAANDNITAEIENLKKSNAALRKQSKEIEHNNKDMRAELKTLQGHLGIAKDFAAKSLTSTDDSKNSLLQVLRGNRGAHGSHFGHHHHDALVETASSSKRKNSDDDDDDEDSDDASQDSSDDHEDDEEADEDEGATSFLSLSARRAKSTDGAASFEAAMSDLESAVPTVSSLSVDTSSNQSPGDLLDVLSKEVAHLAQQTKESENNLKQIFIRDFRVGAKRHNALLAKQKALVATRTSLLAVQDKLKKAEAHLESTHKQLDAKLHGLGQFLQKLAHFAMAPQNEVPHLLEVLPKAVAVKGEKLV